MTKTKEKALALLAQEWLKSHNISEEDFSDWKADKITQLFYRALDSRRIVNDCVIFSAVQGDKDIPFDELIKYRQVKRYLNEISESSLEDLAKICVEYEGFARGSKSILSLVHNLEKEVA